MNNSWHVRM